jgi:lysophospholipase L1-like esterase
MVFVNGSIGGETLDDVLERVESVLEATPSFKYFTIGYGTNDSWGNNDAEQVGFERKLRKLIEAIVDAGRVPILARISYASEA